MTIIIIIAVILFIALVIRMSVKNASKKPLGRSSKDQDTILSQVNKRLAQNPRDPKALFISADIYFKQENWNKAFNTYKILSELTGTNSGIDAFEVYVRYGLCALQIEQLDDAYKAFNEAWAIRQDNFEVNYNMGYLEFQQKNYEKAVQFFSLARKYDGEDSATLRYLGHAFFNLNKHIEAMAFVRKAIELAPDDKEALYILGKCYLEAGHQEQALRIFAHLRADPVKGPSASLFAGIINVNLHKFEQAIEDFELGLKHKVIEPDVLIELRYQLANVTLKLSEIGKAIGILKVIQADNPQYKDVASLIDRYEELNRNQNLQIFTLGPSVDFVALCRKIVLSYYNKSKTKIVNIAVHKNEWVDIIADIETAVWTDLVIFRFIRSQGSIGELVVRDFHSRLKEMKASKGLCITVGTFSEEARRYTEARLIDLLEKSQLLPILITVDTKITKAVPQKKTSLNT